MLDESLAASFGAMPQMSDPRFVRSVIYLCAHGGETGAMGLVIKTAGLVGPWVSCLPSSRLSRAASRRAPVHFGGPVTPDAACAAHADYCEEATLHVDGRYSVTATLEVLRGDRRRPRAAP